MQTSLMTPKCQTSGKSKICSVKFWTTPLHYTICLLKRRKTSNSLRQTLRSHFTLLYQELMGHVWPVNTFISINVGVNLWLQEKKRNQLSLAANAFPEMQSVATNQGDIRQFHRLFWQAFFPLFPNPHPCLPLLPQFSSGFQDGG